MALSKRTQEKLAKLDKLRQEQSNRVAGDGSVERSSVPVRSPASRIMREVEGGLQSELDKAKGRAQELEAENESLQKLLQGLEDAGIASAIDALDPKLVDVVGFNRLPSSFDPSVNKAFGELLDNIREVGGNLQPGLVRRELDAKYEWTGRYELIYGERRLRACEAANLSYNAIVAEIPDDKVWLYREAENFARQDKNIVERALSAIAIPESVAYGDMTAIQNSLGMSKSQLRRFRMIQAVPESVWSLVPGSHSLTRREAEVLVGYYSSDPALFSDQLKAHKGSTGRTQFLASIKAAFEPPSSSAPVSKHSLRLSGGGISMSLQLSKKQSTELFDELKAWLSERGISLD
ncbi:MAG: ParB/RepB/Spo0J family partition protein [Planctomycetales bacterium]|nr:ParB/RepB/Spo0J family partition protein [Planctomycetales bacterium]